MTRSVYIIGGSGAGKSTLMAQLLEDWEVGPYSRLTTRELFGHYLQRGDETGIYLGHLRPGAYPGTDALSLSVAPQALLWLESLPLLGIDWVFAEGTRLSHMGFLTALAAATDLTLIHLEVPDEVAAQRRLDRGGKQLTDQFCRVVKTKASNVAEACRQAGIRVETR